MKNNYSFFRDQRSKDSCKTYGSINFHYIFPLSGKLKPTTAFMMGKLKINGDLQKAMKLEKLMKLLKNKV